MRTWSNDATGTLLTRHSNMLDEQYDTIQGNPPSFPENVVEIKKELQSGSSQFWFRIELHSSLIQVKPLCLCAK